MDDTKREELGKACKKEKDQKVRTRMVAVRMVRVRNMSVDETADILVQCPTRFEFDIFECLKNGLPSNASFARYCGLRIKPLPFSYTHFPTCAILSKQCFAFYKGLHSSMFVWINFLLPCDHCRVD